MNTIKTLRTMVRDHNPSQIKLDRSSVAMLLDEIENLEQSKNHFMNCCEKTSQRLAHTESVLNSQKDQNINLSNLTAELKETNYRLSAPRIFHNPQTGALSDPEHLVFTIESLMHSLKRSQSDHGTDKGKLRQIQSILDKAE